MPDTNKDFEHFRFKTNPPSLGEIIWLQSITHSDGADVLSAMAFCLSRLLPGQLKPSDLMDDYTLSDVMELVSYAVANMRNSDGKYIYPDKSLHKKPYQERPGAGAPSHSNNVDNVALTDDEKERLSKLMQQMRERQ